MRALKLPRWLRLKTIDGAEPQLVGTPGPADVGKHEVVLEVSDGQDTTQQTFVIEVESSNHPPIFISKPPAKAKAGTDFAYTIATADPDDEPAEFAEADLPARAIAMLRAHCFGCHNQQKKKGDLILESREAALAFGAFVAGDASNSLLLEVLAPDADPHMPPKKQLTDDQIALLRNWIDAGAQWDPMLASDHEQTSQTTAVLPASYQPVMALALSPDAKRLAIGRGSDIHLHDVESEQRKLLGKLSAHKDAVRSLAFSPDGRWLATGGYRRVVIWDTQAMSKAHEIGELKGRITALAFSPDGTLLAASDGQLTRDSTIRLWTVSDAEPKADWPAHQDTVFDLAFSPNGQWIATAGADSLVKLWDLHTHEELAKFEGHAGHVLALAFKPDNTRLASGGADQKIKVWNVEDRTETRTIADHRGAITALVWTESGDKIISACEDGLVRVCHERRGDAERKLEGAADVVYCVASADPATIYAGSHEGVVFVWAADGKVVAKLGEEELGVSGEKEESQVKGEG